MRPPLPGCGNFAPSKLFSHHHFAYGWLSAESSLLTLIVLLRLEQQLSDAGVALLFAFIHTP